LSLSEKELEEALDMFLMPAWKRLIDEVEDQIDLITIDSCQNADDLFYNKGRLAVLRMFSGFEQYVRQSIEIDDDDTLQ
jgi:hypothetical protein